jgi:hypothetical protein
VAVASRNVWGDDGFFGFFFQHNLDSGNTRRGGGQYYRPVQRGLW